jgi:hypothetical protein
MQTMTLAQTYQLWGGLHPATKLTGVLKVIDVTPTACQLLPTLPSTARIGSVHISYRSALFAGRRSRSVAQMIVTARADLIRHGFTHVAVTGPFVFEIAKRRRLQELWRYANHALIAEPYQALFRCMIAACLLFPPNWASARVKRLLQLGAAAGQGFRCHAIFTL